MEFIRERLTGEDFRGEVWSSWRSVECSFLECRFDGLTLKPAQVGVGRKRSVYVRCTFDGASLNMGPAGGKARFEDCSFLDVNIRDWFCFDVELVNCVFSGRLSHSFFNGHPLVSGRLRWRTGLNEFWGNDFSNLRMTDVDFRTGIDLSQQWLPIGPEYLVLADPAEALPDSRAWASRLPLASERHDAGIILDTIEEHVSGGQEQVFFSVGSVPPDMRPVLDKLFGFWRQRGADALH